MHFKILEIIHFLEEKFGKNPAKFFETGPEPKPDIQPEPDSAGYSVGSYSQAKNNIYRLKTMNYLLNFNHVKVAFIFIIWAPIFLKAYLNKIRAYN